MISQADFDTIIAQCYKTAKEILGEYLEWHPKSQQPNNRKKVSP